MDDEPSLRGTCRLHLLPEGLAFAMWLDETQRVNPIGPFADRKLEDLLTAGYRVVFALLETEDIGAVFAIGLQSPYNRARRHDHCETSEQEKPMIKVHIFS